MTSINDWRQGRTSKPSASLSATSEQLVTSAIVLRAGIRRLKTTKKIATPRDFQRKFRNKTDNELSVNSTWDSSKYAL